MKAEPIFREKRFLAFRRTGGIGIVELKVWGIPKSKDYPAGRKFSLFLVLESHVIVGLDNHWPKGPHLHLGERELPYEYVSDDALVADFWELVRKAGFEP